MTVQNLDVAQRAGALLPVDWSIVQLRDVLHQRADRVPIQPDGCYTRLGVRWYGGGPFVKDAVQGSEIKSTTLFAAYPKDFIYNRLFAWKGSFGVVGSYGLPVFVSGEFPTFEVDGARMDAEYLWRWFSQPAVWRDIEAQSTGSTQVSRLRFKEDDLLRLSVPCPPVPEQRAIARILRTVERAREATAATIAATAQLRQSLMRHRFTYGPVPVQEAERVAVKDTGIGHAPADWEMRPLGDLCRIVTGSTPPTARADYYDGTIPFVRTSEIVNNVIAHASMFVSEAAVRDCKLRLLPPGTVLLAMYGQGKTRGQVGLLDIAATTTQNAAALLPSEALDPGFLWLYLQSQYEALRGDGAHGHISHLNLGYVRQFRVPCPPLDVQRAIAGLLMTADAKARAEQARWCSLDTLFRTLLGGLLSGALRVSDPELGDRLAEVAG